MGSPLLSGFNIDGETTEVVLESHAHVKNIVLSFIKPMVLRCAMELGIPRVIHEHGGPMRTSQLADHLSLLPAKAPYLAQLMRVLEFSGFLTKQKMKPEDEEEGYVLTPLSRSLLIEDASSFVLAFLQPSMVSPYQNLTAWFRTDQDLSPYHTANGGKSIWEFGNENPESNDLFNGAMAHDSRIVTPLLINKCSELAFFDDGVKTFVDVGGGIGVVARSFAEAFPGLRCTAYDLPQVVGSLVSDDKVQFVAGNMFESVPTADALLLKLILHDYGDEDCLKILKNCKEALTTGGKTGKLIIVDIVIHVTKGNTPMKTVESQVLLDMYMMGSTGGKERDEHEWKNLFTQAGFANYKITPLTYLKSLIEVYP